ncbi:MAG: hypothetical protein NT121_07005 [Chloroflexi bacterium]|nr:hypothetical protein [Chloroflexota bacterium]
MQKSLIVEADAEDILIWMQDWFYQELMIRGYKGFTVDLLDNKIQKIGITFHKPRCDFETMTLVVDASYILYWA